MATPATKTALDLCQSAAAMRFIDDCMFYSLNVQEVASALREYGSYLMENGRSSVRWERYADGYTQREDSDMETLFVVEYNKAGEVTDRYTSKVFEKGYLPEYDFEWEDDRYEDMPS